MVGDDTVAMETSDDDLGRLDIDLDRKSKRLKLTSSNVRAILHVSNTPTHTPGYTHTRTHTHTPGYTHTRTHTH